MRLRPRAVVALLLVFLAALALPPGASVVDPLTGDPAVGAGLHLPAGYLLLAPLSGVWDHLTLLTVQEHVAVLVSLLGAFLLWRIVRRRQPRGVLRRAAIEAGTLLAFFVALLGFYTYGVLGPRPMAALRVEDPEEVVVDFHSHTRASHDGRESFTVERNLEWHRGAGYHVAYITDHDSIRPALEAVSRNPGTAGEGLVVLAGREVVYAGQHVIVLGTVDPREGPAAGTGGVVDPEVPCAGWPVLIQTLPNNLQNVARPECTDLGAGVEALELIDADPRGLAQAGRELEHILDLADSLDLTLLSSSNLHGWGRTAAGWSLLRIPGWRGMASERLASRIEEIVRFGPDDALRVVSVRPLAPPAEGAAVAAIPVVTLLDFAGRRSRAERVVWVLWLLAAMGVARGLRDRPARNTAPREESPAAPLGP